jgi:hypothetical protein
VRKNNTEEAARCFVRRIGSPSRGGKRVDLLAGDWSGSIFDRAWIAGALSTTALRKRPSSILPPLGSLGYAKAQMAAESAAQSLARAMRQGSATEFGAMLSDQCSALIDEAQRLGLHWTFGRSQKFFNILTKYWFCVAVGHPTRLKAGERELALGFSNCFHAAVDSVTLRHVRRDDTAPDLEGIYWGWNLTECKYLEIQQHIRQKADVSSLSPVAYELEHIW